MKVRSKLNLSPLAEAALHEAGHTVAAIHFGIGVRYVWARDDGAGLTKRLDCQNSDPFTELVSTYAGPAAEGFGGGCGSIDMHDLEYAQEALRCLTKADSERAEEYVSWLVQAYWPSIVHLAQALVRKRQLSGAEACHIVLGRRGSNQISSAEMAAWCRSAFS